MRKRRIGLTRIEQAVLPYVPPAADVAPPSPLLLDDLVDDRTRELIRGRRFGKTHRRGWIVRRALLAADVAGLGLAFAFAEVAFGRESTVGLVGPWVEFVGFLVTLPLWVVIARLLGLYNRDEEHADHTTVDDVAGVFVLVTVCAFLLIGLAWVTGAADPYVPKLLTFWAAAVTLVSLSRGAARSCVRQSDAYQQNAVIVGAGDVAQLIGSKILRRPEYGINLLGFVDKTPRSRRDDIGELTVLGEISQLPLIVDALDVERVIVAFAGQDQGRLLEDLRQLRSEDVQIDVVPRFFDIVGPGAEFHAIEGFPLVGVSPARLPRSSLMSKRALDLIGAALGLLLLSPLFFYLAIRIKLDSPGPVFFRQERPGLGGAPIRVVKFRTMASDPTSADGRALKITDAVLNEEYLRQFKLRDDTRITKLGRMLRRTSLDELPQLWNVLRGDMSLVGPRPMLVVEFERRGEEASAQLAVKPGITGLWQINGRSDLDYADRLRLELAYVGDWTLGLDLTILGKTIRTVAHGRGAR